MCVYDVKYYFDKFGKPDKKKTTYETYMCILIKKKKKNYSNRSL